MFSCLPGMVVPMLSFFRWIRLLQSCSKVESDHPRIKLLRLVPGHLELSLMQEVENKTTHVEAHAKSPLGLRIAKDVMGWV